MVRVVLDAMGGDHAPAEPVLGALQALDKSPDLFVVLTGIKEEIEKLLEGKTYDKDRLSVVHAAEVIGTAEHPVAAIRSKKDSSMVVGMKLIKDGYADAMVSSGNSGALMVGAQLIVGRIKGVDRVPFAQLIPTARGRSLLLDCGANVDVRPEHLVSFARMGSEYFSASTGTKAPSVGIVNIGAEEEKGNALVNEAMPLLKECGDINFTGCVEANMIPKGKAGVIICDGFTGNIIVKLYEGLGKLMMNVVKDAFRANLRSKMGALLAYPSLKASFSAFDTKSYGGAPILGLKGLVIKTHGNAKSEIFCNALLQCLAMKQNDQGE